jgi:phosphoadenosine phosphosulfate reductase
MNGPVTPEARRHTASIDEAVIERLRQLDRRDVAGMLTLLLAHSRPDRVALVTSFGAEGMVLVDHLRDIRPRPRVVFIDTGRLPPETHATRRRAEADYGLAVEVVHPDPVTVDEMVAVGGVNLFYRSVADRVRCCAVRKVEPLRRALAGWDAWITGLRRTLHVDQAPVQRVARDARNGGLWKVAPLADWSSEEVWDYLRSRDVPYNPLYDSGYASIGCAPCTRPTAPGAPERSGRWWWEQGTTAECGMHYDPA